MCRSCASVALLIRPAVHGTAASRMAGAVCARRRQRSVRDALPAALRRGERCPIPGMVVAIHQRGAALGGPSPFRPLRLLELRRTPQAEAQRRALACLARAARRWRTGPRRPIARSPGVQCTRRQRSLPNHDINADRPSIARRVREGGCCSTASPAAARPRSTARHRRGPARARQRWAGAEIGLAPQMLARFLARLGDGARAASGSTTASAARLTAAWRARRVLFGTRSAVFSRSRRRLIVV